MLDTATQWRIVAELLNVPDYPTPPPPPPLARLSTLVVLRNLFCRSPLLGLLGPPSLFRVKGKVRTILKVIYIKSGKLNKKGSNSFYHNQTFFFTKLWKFEVLLNFMKSWCASHRLYANSWGDVMVSQFAYVLSTWKLIFFILGQTYSVRCSTNCFG